MKGRMTSPMADPRRGVDSWLRWLLASQRTLLLTALLTALAGAGLFILQSWLLAGLFSDWLRAWQAGELLQPRALWAVLPGLAVCLVLRPLLQHAREYYAELASLRARNLLRGLLQQRLAMLGPARRVLGADGQLTTGLLEQVDALDSYMARYQVQSRLVVLVPLAILLATAWYSLAAAALLLLTAPLVPLFMVLLGRAAEAASQHQFNALGRMSGRFLDLLRGLPTLRQLQALPLAVEAVDSAAEEYRWRTMQVLRMAFLSTAVLEFFAALAIALVAVYLGLGLLGLLPWAKGEIPVPYQGALFILLLAPEFYAPLRQLGSDYHARAEARAAITELLPLLQMEVWHPAGTAHPDRPGAPALRLRQLRVAGSDGRLRMAPLDLDVAAGQRLLVQGQSGSGKSTLLNVLLGFVPYQGEAQVYAQELADLDRTAWQVRIGYLAQQPELLAASVADNLRLAAPGASDGELWQVLEKVGLATLLRRLPLGLDTPLGERGLGLSGGEQSRLALARLLLRDASLWLLDEPLAHLDPETAEQIGALIERLSRGRTLLLVSHGSGGLDWLESVHELVPAQGQTI